MITEITMDFLILREKVIDYFFEKLGSWDYESWSSAGASAKEEIVKGALVDLEVKPENKEKVYELFWMWADGIDEDAFGEAEEE